MKNFAGSGFIFYGTLQAFVWTILTFFIIEKKNINIEKVYIRKASWNITKLPKLPSKKAIISTFQSVFKIIFTTIFYTIL